jgi:ATP-binding cassette subfamily B protein
MQSTLPITDLLSRLWIHISRRRRVQFGFLLVLMILVSFAEILSIGAVLPFLGALTAPNRIFEHPAAQPFIQTLGLTSANQILLPLTIAFGLAAIVAGAMRLLQHWFSVRLSFSVGVDLSMSVYRRTLYQPYAVHIARNSSEVINGITVKVSEVIFYILMPV